MHSDNERKSYATPHLVAMETSPLCVYTQRIMIRLYSSHPNVFVCVETAHCVTFLHLPTISQRGQFQVYALARFLRKLASTAFTGKDAMRPPGYFFFSLALPFVLAFIVPALLVFMLSELSVARLKEGTLVTGD